MFEVQGSYYELIQNIRDGWNIDAFEERYSEVLSKYDYIVGDWGYGQLRLRGFYDDNNKKVKAAFDAKISTLDEYIHEYCNFGCSYFVVKKGKASEGEKVKEDQLESDESHSNVSLNNEEHPVTFAEDGME